METTITEYAGMALIAVSVLIFTAQRAYAYGFRSGGNTERLLADRRVRGVLDYENKRRPKARSRNARLVGTISMPSLEVRA